MREKDKCEAKKAKPFIKACAQCGVSFITKKALKKFCSKVCGQKNWMARNPLLVKEQQSRKLARQTETRKPRQQLGCCICSKPFQPKTVNSKYCSARCQYRGFVGPEVRLKCEGCASLCETSKGRPKKWCSSICQKRSPKYKQLRKAARAARKAKERGASGYVNVRPEIVFIRDEWHCKACGTHTPPSLRGTCDLIAPELDHIMPLSKGGAHTMSNLQCLCRRCNSLKSDTVGWVLPAQYRQAA